MAPGDLSAGKSLILLGGEGPGLLRCATVLRERPLSPPPATVELAACDPIKGKPKCYLTVITAR